ncbi:TonB-dependent siderophore receptor [Phenylobacterium sp.]|uniref:TonB-dependent siderophore receptor n=1 Tax=Phenylobacterium sp. TaxID=1871053 RepID=UPI0030017469
MHDTTLRRSLMLAASLMALAAPAVADDEAPTRVSELIVTGQDGEVSVATKTDTPLLQTPQAISVITADVYQARGAVSLQEVLNYSAGVRSDAYGNDGRVDSFFVRGTTPAQYLDGMRSSYAYYDTAKVDPYALSQVEVMRGPSSVLYGQGSIGGIVNLTSKRPEFGRRGEAIASLGSFERKQVQLDLTGPIDAAGTLAYRFTGLYRDAETQVDHIGDDRLFLAPSITWRPSADTELTLLVHHQEDRTGSTTQFLPHQGTLLPNVNGQLPSNTFISEPDVELYRAIQSNVSLFVRHRFNPHFEYRLSARGSWSDVNYQTMYPNSYFNPLNPWVQPGEAGYVGPQRSTTRYISYSFPESRAYSIDHQFQANFRTGGVEHTLLFGVDGQQYRQFMESGSALTTPIDLFDPVYGNYVEPVVTRKATTEQEQLGVYLQDQIRLGGWNLILGVRRDEATTRSIAVNSTVTEKTSDATTYRAGLLYAFEGGLSAYVSYSESFLPVAGANIYGEPFEPQMGKQWEAGLKWQPAPQYLATAAVFDIRDTNRLTADPTNPQNRIQTGEVQSRGFEVEGRAIFREVYDLSVNYTYNEVEVSESTNPQEVGKPFASQPLHAASAWGTRRFRIGADGELSLGLGVRYVGETTDQDANRLFILKTPAVTLFDALAAYEQDNWRLSLNVQNLEDEYYFSSCLVRGDCFIGSRRKVIGALTYRF